MSITILDGGMGQELVRRSAAKPTPLWATQVMIDQPQIVQEIHADFFAAGAEIATTNTYAIHRDRLEGTGFEDRFEDLHRIALDMAHAARDAHGSGLIAGAIGPLGASYRADLLPPHEKAVHLMAEVAHLIADRCDMVLFETLVSVAQTRVALEAVRNIHTPVWFAFSVDDEDGTRLRSGEPLSEAAELCDAAAALLANCSAPEAMPAAIKVLAPFGKPVGAYANAFTQITKDFLKDKPTVDALSPRRDMGPKPYADQAERWVAEGATIIGGCCETGPDHIAELARRFGKI
jgi:homocysteine S-methyltransferase